jgi:hypothetical protein
MVGHLCTLNLLAVSHLNEIGGIKPPIFKH